MSSTLLVKANPKDEDTQTYLYTQQFGNLSDAD